jgi:ATP-binding cassette subfamily B protein
MLRLIRYAYRLSPGDTVAVLAARVAVALLLVAVPVLAGQAIGRLPDALAHGVDRALVLSIAGLVAAFLLAQVVSVAAEIALANLTGLVDKETTLSIGRALSSGPGMSRLEDPEVTAAVQLVRSRRMEIETAIRLGVGPSVQALLRMSGTMIALALAINWWSALALAIAVAVEALYMSRRMVRDLDQARVEDLKHARYAFQLAMSQAPKELRIFGMSDFLRQRYWDYYTTACAPRWRVRRRQAWSNLLIMGARWSVTGAVLAYLARLAHSGQIDLTRLSTALPLLITVGAMDTWMFALLSRGASVLRLLEDLTSDGRSAPSSQPARASRTFTANGNPRQEDASRRPPVIVFDDVSFRYPTSPRLVLDCLSLELPAGSASALVGLNGAGKSTIVRLLAGVYLPTRGHVLVDGRNLAKLEPEELLLWQRRLAPVTQDFARLMLSAGNNVELGGGRPWSTHPIPVDGARSSSTTALDRLGRRSGIADIIDRLPAGWDTALDSSIPGGVDLSGGEWQRLALTRALRAVESGADVLILDEPAAALDVDSEVRLVASYLELTDRLTSLIISHRFSVVRPVPKIHVLAEGRIVESGSHDELMQRRGRYHDLFLLQARRYVQQPGAREDEEC